jgi:hypothetical protein
MKRLSFGLGIINMFAPLTRKLSDASFLLGRSEWASDSDICPQKIEGIEESLSDFNFCRGLERKGIGLLAKNYYQGEFVYPLQVILSDLTLATKEEIEDFARITRFQFGNPAQIEVVRAYQYLRIFEKYQSYLALPKRSC